MSKHHHHSRNPHEAVPLIHANKASALSVALLVTVLAMAVQFYGAWLSGSLALLSDTFHVLTDAVSLLMSLAAVYLSAQAATEERTFGWHRLEVLSGFVNGLVLGLMAIGIFVEGGLRLRYPHEVGALALSATAALGLSCNLVAAFVLHRAMGADGHAHHGHAHHGHDHSHHHSHEQEQDRNLQGAYLHVLSDVLGSVAVILGGLLTYFTHVTWIDPLIAMVLALLIFRWAFLLTKDTLHVLLEGTPAHVNLKALRQEMQAVNTHIRSVDHLHVWEITSKMYSLTADVFVDDMPLSEADQIRETLEELLGQKFGIGHMTITMLTKMR